MTRTFSIAVGAVVAATAAIAAHLATSSHTVALHERRAAAVPAPASDVRYPGIGARFRTSLTPSERAAAQVGAESAVSTFAASKVRPELTTSPRSVALAVFSDDALGPAGPDGLPRPTIQDRLAWVITVPDAPVVLYGPAGTSVDSATTCDFVFVVDARTGTALTAFQGCGKE